MGGVAFAREVTPDGVYPSIEHQFSHGGVSAPTEPPTELSPWVLARLDQTLAAITDWRTARARVLDAVHTLETESTATEAGYPSPSRLLADHTRLDRAEITVLRRHARLTHGSLSPTPRAAPRRPHGHRGTARRARA